MEITIVKTPIFNPYKTNSRKWTLWNNWHVTKGRICSLKWDKVGLDKELKREEEYRVFLETTLKSLDPKFNPKEYSDEEELNLDGLDIGSIWKHHSGRFYKIEYFTNITNLNPKYPVQIVYTNIDNGTIWSRDARDWHRSFELVN